jgi:hypothetical protein
VLGFPNPVNEKAARVVAGGVVVMAVVTLLTGWQWVIGVMALGFLARVLTGPRLSLLGQFATRLVAPRLGAPTMVPGPPKRFASGIGLALTAVAAIASFGFGATLPATTLVAVVLVFALMESVIGFCTGCWLFGLLMKLGLIPRETCEACDNVWDRYGGRPTEVGPLVSPRITERELAAVAAALRRGQQLHEVRPLEEHRRVPGRR